MMGADEPKSAILGGSEDEVAAAARGSAEPYTYAAQVDGFARIYSRSTRATCDFS